MFEKVGEVLREVLYSDTCTTWHVLLLLLPIKVLPHRQVMVLDELRPQVVRKVFEEDFNWRASGVLKCGLRLEIPSIHFRLMAILSGDPGLVGVDLLIQFPFHPCGSVVTNAVTQDFRLQSSSTRTIGAII